MRAVLAGAALVNGSQLFASPPVPATPAVYAMPYGEMLDGAPVAPYLPLAPAQVPVEQAAVVERVGLRDTLAAFGLLGAGMGALAVGAAAALRKPFARGAESAVAEPDLEAAGRAARVATLAVSGTRAPAVKPAPRPAPRAAAPKMAVEAPVKTPLSTVSLKNAAGDSVTVYPFGACVTSYVKNGVDVLMVRPDAKLDGSKPISGGIPHCFPQFGPGAIQQHGFARNVDWDVVEKSETKVVMELKENEYTLSMWPYKFCATYTVTLADDALKTELCVLNTGDQSFDFTAALHSYWSISGVKNIKISSDAFAGASYLDKTASPPAQTKATGTDVAITKETDSVYAGVSGEVLLADSERARPLKIVNQLGWSDTVVWNPYGDEGMGYDQFVCVESAQASTPVKLTPGEYWTGAMDVVP